MKVTKDWKCQLVKAFTKISLPYTCLPQKICSMKSFDIIFRVLYVSMNRSSHQEVFLGKGVLKIYSKFKGEHPCRSAISIKLLCKQFYWNHTSAWVFSCKFAAYFQNTFSQKHLWMTASVWINCSLLIGKLNRNVLPGAPLSLSFCKVVSLCLVEMFIFH